MRFTVTQKGRYWIVTDGETGAQWPYMNVDAARAAAATANSDATNMRDQIAAAPPEATIPVDEEVDPNMLFQEAP